AEAQPVRWTTLAPGLSFTRVVWKHADGGEVEMLALRADSRRYTIRTLVSPSRTTARSMSEEWGAIAVVNGPFFDTAGKPMGLVIADGRRVQGWPPPSGANGCVF